jgi:hypothetical protein
MKGSPWGARRTREREREMWRGRGVPRGERREEWIFGACSTLDAGCACSVLWTREMRVLRVVDSVRVGRPRGVVSWVQGVYVCERERITL